MNEEHEPSEGGATADPGVPLEELLGAVEAGVEAERAAAPAAPQKGAQRTADPAVAGRFVIFDLGRTRCALPIDRVAEIGEVPKITPVPHVPRWVRGVANLRGDILAVIDLRARIGLPPVDPESRKGRMLIVRSSPGPLGEVAAGLLVDAVSGVSRVDRGALAPPEEPIDDGLTPLLDKVLLHEGWPL